jgi:hypothetical protein
MLGNYQNDNHRSEYKVATVQYNVDWFDKEENMIDRSFQNDN